MLHFETKFFRKCVSIIRQSCHNWNLRVEWNVLIGNSFFHYFIFYIFIFCFRRLSKTIESLVNFLWHVCQTWFLRVQMNVFNRNVLFEKKPKRFLVFIIIFDFQGKSCDMWKRFSLRLKKSLYVSRVTIPAEKHFYLIQFQFTFSGFSGPRAEKKFHLRSQVFGKFGGVHSTRSDKHFLENIFFGESFIFQSILYIEKNLFETSQKIPTRKKCLYWFIRVGGNVKVEFFSPKKMCFC